MNHNQLFRQTRLQLACWYAGVMGVILGLCGWGMYEAIAHAHWMTLDRELESVAGTLHDSLEPVLQEPGQLEPEVGRLLPDLCTQNEQCWNRQFNRERHAIGALHQGDYYVRLLDLTDNLIAVAGVSPDGLPGREGAETWQTFTDSQGTRFHQISVVLHTQDSRDWGSLEVGRSLKEFDDYLGAVKVIMLIGLPIALFGVGTASWGLAGVAMQPIYQSYRQIQQFTADAAHELRTPLAAIRATVESNLRVDSTNFEDIIETLKTVDRQNLRLSQLVNDLLLLSRMDQQELPLKPSLCCLNDVISDVEEEIAVLAIASQVKLTTEVRVQQAVRVKGNEEELYRLLFNLVSNGIQYTPVGGKVTLILDASDRHAIIQVKDTGIGIHPQDLNQIFDRFYRVNSDRARHTGGSGLGLAIAQAIAKTHHGNIQVQSELGQGSLFTIRLPILESA
ncbi:two-component system sensor histidine kinase RppB [Oscillatoria acuminata]|uniref:histidine kinase n=1 Tax=Oscillatoria acuminata PCC 6304 TaxID=56110 RepID=K9TNR4_9CYAN|nr:two-component system sensor histidine kinase RppB [Oscillatoria acuminata]AFY84190.1 histidine kinase [Oscillatoria acuminata PCC 6304]